MRRVKTKICGLTRVEDVIAAEQAGADALGFVFYPPSPRAVTADQAAILCQKTGPFVTRVGLFVDPTPAQVKAVLSQVPLDLLQFHGEESEAFCRQFGRPYIKALRMRPDFNPAQAPDLWPSATGFLLDAYKPGVPGGTGECFDWRRFPQGSQVHWILAGGLNPDNVSQAIESTRPYAVDVSGGVEAAPGIKCAAKIHALIQGVHCVSLC